MRGTLLLFALAFLGNTLFAQNVYTIKADSVKLTGCDSSELIIENHTQNVPGFLFNTGNGRTIFKRGSQKLNDSSYLIGADTLKLRSNGWVQGGNAFGTTGVLGTLDNNHLDLYSNDTARLRLTKTGNLLLGTSTDNGYKLQVNGSGTFSSLYTAPIDVAGSEVSLLMSQGGLIGSYGHNMVFQNPSLATNYYFEFGNTSDLGNPLKTFLIQGNNSGNVVLTSSSNYIDFLGLQNVYTDASAITINTDNYSNGKGLVISRGSRTLSVTDPIFTVVEADTTVFDALKNGNIGIGTNTPSAQLHTTGSVRLAGITNDNTQTRVLVSDASGNLFYRDASTLAANDLPRSSLAVNGTISAKKLQLSQTGWPDYVFDSSYRLLPMTQLEKYIKENNHLPGIPSATEVERKEVDVGENQAALLKKIEELTLYIIDQNKRLARQDNKISSLRKEVEELKQVIITKSTNK